MPIDAENSRVNVRQRNARPLVVASAVSAVSVACQGIIVLAQPFSERVTVAVGDLGPMFAAAAAAVACWSVARHAQAMTRTAWLLLAAATASWAAGEAVWSWYEIVAGREVPFPSMADAGFLGFTLLSVVALLVLPVGRAAPTSRARGLVDGLLTAGALLALAMTTSLGATLESGGGWGLATFLSLAYPLGDVALLTLMLLTLGRASDGRRLVLALLAVGLAAFAVADSAFVYLTVNGLYASGNLCDLGWAAGFLVLMLAAIAARSPDLGRPDDARAVVPSWLQLVLPYLPTALAVGVTGARLIAQPERVPAAEIALTTALVGLVLVRQFLTLLDHQSLLTILHAEREQARHQALHDALTGLANRNLFLDRLEHAVTLRQRDGQPISVLFCDLDDFKSVNDGLGHAAGDQLLRIVADRLQSCLRPADTVARLGGDEFAVLIEQTVEAPSEVAARLVDVLASPVVIDGVLVTVTASVGLVSASPSRGDWLGAGELLRRADAAMYEAKGSGKATWVLHDLTALDSVVRQV